MCAGVPGSAWVCASVCGCALVCVCVRGYARVCEGMRRGAQYGRVCIGVHKLTKFRQNLMKNKKILLIA